MIKLRTPNKPKTKSVPRRLRVLLITVMVLLIPLLTYFTLYISSRTAYFTSRNFRQLASISVQIEEKIENLRGAFETVVRTTLEKQIEMQQASAALKQSKRDEASFKPPTFKQALAASGTGFVAAADGPSIPVYTDRKVLEKDLGSENVKMQLITGGETSRLFFGWRGFKVEIKLDSIVNPLIGKRNIESIRGSEHEEGFDAILIATLDENLSRQGTSQPAFSSKVIFQQGTPELDIDSLDNLPRSDTSDKTIDLTSLSRSTGSADVRIGETNYKMYLQPLELPVPTVPPAGQADPNRQGSRWVACGLVQASHFRTQTWAFPYTLLIVFAFVIALVTLSWPFLKLLFIGPKDRLRLADVYFIAFALFIGSAILTFFMLFGVTYEGSERKLDDQLENFSQNIVDRFYKEVSEALDEIDELNSDPELSPALKEIREQSKNPQLAWLRGFEGTRILETHQKDPYPYFDRAAWIDRTGVMLFQKTIEPSTSYISVKTRDFFLKILDGSSRGPGDKKYWIEPVNSRYTAAKTGLVARPLYGRDPNGAEVIKGIVAFDAPVMSLVQTVVPSGFGYRIIDNSGHDPGDDDQNDPGKVIFQSSDSQQLRENFFEECDNDHSLRSLVFGRGKDFVDVNYKGEGNRLYVRPIKNFPNWSLIVFRNKQPLRTVYLEILTLAGSIFLLYAVVLLVFFTVIYLIKTSTQDRTGWIWPSQESSGIYYQSFLFNMILCCLSVIVISVLDGWRAVNLICLISFIGIFSIALRLKFRLFVNRLNPTVESFRVKKFFDKRDTYAWNMALLLVLVGILPAVALFKVSYNEEMKLFVKHGQITIAQGLQEREARIRSQYSTERADPDNNPGPIKDGDAAERFIKRRLNDPLGMNLAPDVYDYFFFETTRSSTGSASKNTEAPEDSLLFYLNRFVPFFMPFFNETSIEMGGLRRNQAADKSWQWQESEGNLVLHIDGHGTEVVQISTPAQRFGAPPPSLSLFLWALGFLTIFMTVFGLTRFVVRRVFLLDVDEALSISRLPKDISAITQNLFVIQSWPLAHQDGSLQTDQSCRIDLATESPGEVWLEKFAPGVKNETLPNKVIVGHFEYHMNDPSVNYQKLRLIEALLAANKTVVIMSSAEPATYSFDGSTGEREHKAETQPIGPGDRWAETISRFRKVYSVENDDAEIDTAISKLKAYLEANLGISKQRRTRILQLSQFVRKECRSPVCVRIGREIIEQPGFEEMKPDQILGQIFDRAELLYKKIWDNCSEGEKLTLKHLAGDRLLSPNDPDIKPLYRKGLVVRAPDIGLMNETFKRFVLTQCLSEDLGSVEAKAKKSSPWEALKVPLLICFFGAVLFLVLTQKDVYSSSWTFVTALTTGIPAVFKLLSLFQGESAGQKSFNA